MAPESLRILKFAVNRRTLAAPYNRQKGVGYRGGLDANWKGRHPPNWTKLVMTTPPPLSCMPLTGTLEKNLDPPKSIAY